MQVKNECNRRDIQRQKKKVTVENNLHLLLEVMSVVEVLDFIVT
jgi:hypothetical protein